MKTGYVVADVMTTKPVTCGPEVSAQDAAKLLKEHDISSVLVTEGKKLIGIVTDKDFVYRLVAGGMDHSSPVRKIMSSVIYSVGPGMDIVDAVKYLNKYDIHHLPVMEDEKLVGYVTTTNIMKLEPQLLELLAEKAQVRAVGPNSPLFGLVDEGEAGLEDDD